ncbi:hypothetical protein, partial [Sphingobacterium multivorum]|uniref:hypothetical protein n=1 Tax=Sphingobacterium multivorum TaxID=28454 RepID=UPI003DA48A9A
SLILDRIEQLLEFVHDFRLSSVYSSRLHDCVFLKNFVASTSVSAIFRGHCAVFIVLFFPSFPLGLQR